MTSSTWSGKLGTASRLMNAEAGFAAISRDLRKYARTRVAGITGTFPLYCVQQPSRLVGFDAVWGQRQLLRRALRVRSMRLGPLPCAVLEAILCCLPCLCLRVSRLQARSATRRSFPPCSAVPLHHRLLPSAVIQLQLLGDLRESGGQADKRRSTLPIRRSTSCCYSPVDSKFTSIAT
jgi:hypothetical protein